MMLAMQTNAVSRRGFLQLGAIGAVGAAGAGYLRSNPLGLPIGCQTWPVRQTIGKDLDGPLAPMPPAELRDKIHAAGLGCESCHFGFGELREHLDERLAFAKELGLKQMIIATFGVPKDGKVADWMHAVDEANKLGERTQKAGIQLGFHNHDFEFQKIDGDLVYDKLMAEFDPQLVKMQFQVRPIISRNTREGSFPSTCKIGRRRKRRMSR